MKISERIKEMFTRNKRTEEQLYDEILEEIENKEQESETIIDEENMYAYYIKDSKKCTKKNIKKTTGGEERNG